MAATVLLGSALEPRRADAFSISLTGDGTSQHLNWFYEGCVTNCVNAGCGSIDASNGRIPLNVSAPASAQGGGKLDWIATSGSLTALGLTTVRAVAQTTGGCAGAWASVDARGTPLVFGILPEAGDPIPLLVDLRIRPRLLGTISQSTFPGGSAFLHLEMVMAVTVDGEIVTRDSLILQQTLVDGDDQALQLAFPRGDGNDVVIPDVSPANDIGISIWAYMRAYCTSGGGTNGIDGSSAYGGGPAIEILVQDANALDVADESPTHRLVLAIGPNPSNAPRIRYTLPRAADTCLSLYDIRGRRVATLVDGLEPAGHHETTWSGKSSTDGLVAPGVYFVELRSGGERLLRKLVVPGR